MLLLLPAPAPLHDSLKGVYSMLQSLCRTGHCNISHALVTCQFVVLGRNTCQGYTPRGWREPNCTIYGCACKHHAQCTRLVRPAADVAGKTRSQSINSHTMRQHISIACMIMHECACTHGASSLCAAACLLRRCPSHIGLS